MLECGWSERAERGYLLSEKALLCFEKRDPNATASISLQWWEALQETTAMLRRTTEYGWQKPQLDLDLLPDEQEQDNVALSAKDAQKFQDAINVLAKLADSTE